MSAARKDFRRNADLAAIHVAKKQFGLDDGTYREMLANLTRGRIQSAADATAEERRTIIEHLRRRGFRPKAPAEAGNVRPLEDRQSRMARGLWIECAKSGAVRDRSERAFLKFAKRITGVERLEWMTPEQANKIIEALKSMKRRTDGRLGAGDGADR